MLANFGAHADALAATDLVLMSFRSLISRTPLEGLVDSHNDLVEHFNRLDEQVHEMRRQSEVEASKEIQSAHFDAASRYVSVIMVAGYAAFYTMWGSMKADLPRHLVLWAGLLMSASTAMFVGFEVVKMTVLAFAHGRIMKAAAHADVAVTHSSMRDVSKAHNRRLNRLWWYGLVPTASLGFGAAGILLWGFVSGLLAWYR